MEHQIIKYMVREKDCLYASEVTWIKESESEGATKYYYGDGTEIVMNPGKTYVALVENTSEVTIKE